MLIAALFGIIAAHRIGFPSTFYFDEIHYVPAARKLLELMPANREHPLLGKELIAASIHWLGDRPLAWRLPSLLFGTIGLFAFGRLVWWASRRRLATIMATALLATNFMWFIQSRIAMLDMVEAGLGMVGLWQFAAALRAPARHARWRLAASGLALGLALGAKWSVLPAAILPGLAFLWLRWREAGWKIMGTRGAGPIPGISLAEAAWWLGLFPLMVYWATFAPAFFYHEQPVSPWGVIEQHRYMIQLQDSVRRLHPYRSVWYQWVANWRAIWFLYENIDGAQRGIVLIGNPFSMLAGLPALAWCAWAGLWRRRGDAAAFVVLYVACLGIWAVNGKPIQFYYHYLLPGAFLMACLALALDALWQRRDRWRWLTPAALIAAFAMAAYFYPIISAAALHGGKQSYARWMWLHSWR
ncbi:phospholipid carrier-dependent glycosyltransferase [Novosphingobium sp. H3SJ31-1]|uniref:Polyprenol-phosphate-mannose--protein mannosyltransferase n=2 Tax=Novosphingobium album (ex Liu et al. 2023) TaxID=3031130 RepID=A0ABT5WTU4_9SPHN|nr:phospholipid carrier-dependent glycosyltransferase [Novosphingobium album (ex Liu et al. 2023)]